MKNYLLLIVFSLFCFSCATAYQPLSFSGGYSSTMLDKNIFKVSFQGNGDTSKERAEDFALLRSSEITLENGFSYFLILDKDVSMSYGSFTTPANTTTTGNLYNYGGVSSFQANSYTTGGQTFLISKPSTTNLIACFKEKPKEKGLIYDAYFIKDSIKQKYQIP